MYYFFFRTGCYDCVRISNLNTEVFRAETFCNYVFDNCSRHTFYNPNLFSFNNNFNTINNSDFDNLNFLN